jgi:hypothetical protein
MTVENARPSDLNKSYTDEKMEASKNGSVVVCAAASSSVAFEHYLPYSEGHR